MRRSAVTPLRALAAIASVTAVACSGLSGCHKDDLQSAEGNIAFAAPELDFGHAWTGQTVEKQIDVSNLGLSPVTLEWAEPGAPFEIVSVPPQLQGGATTSITLRFTGTDPGNASGKVRVRSNAGREALLAVKAVSDAVPKCEPSNCHSATFDVTTGTCVETMFADGIACDPHSVCVTNATCQSGKCVGNAITCDDGNACTIDLCDPVKGCQFPPAPPCPGDGKCQVGTCDPKLGCQLTTASDGTVCGSVTCDAAQVCVSGACVVRDPPDGFVCAEASPCQDEGICSGSQCVRPPATPLAAEWSMEPMVDADGGITGPRLHDMVMEPDGELSLLGFYESPHVRTNGAQPVEVTPSPRRCIGWNSGLACADFGPNATVAELEFDGTERWSFNLSAARPDVAADNDNVFMARVASMGSDRLLGVFETYPKNSATGTQCRGYYLAALDTQGGLVWMQHLTDPFLTDFTNCQHPHPYGVAADGQGNIYLAFSNSVTTSTQAIPLAPQSPTVILSFTRDGAFRWSRTEAIVGGELAVANGLLFEEWATRPFSTATGDPISLGENPLPRAPVGRAVVTSNRYICSPSDGTVADTQIHAYDLNGGAAWTYELPTGDAFLSRELQLVTWQARPERPSYDAVLAFAQRGGENSIVALKANTGDELWSCPLVIPGQQLPQTIAAANGSFAVMTGAVTCGACDPPFANSTASFWQYSAPGMKPMQAPWAGTYAGPLHDHVEKALPPVLPTVSN